MKIKIAPSLLAADWLRLGEEVRSVQDLGADLLHMDIMDGHFVPNLTMGPHVVRAVAKIAKVPLDVHLMMNNTTDFIERFAEAGASIIGFHIEATRDPQSLIARIHECGKRACVAVNPSTPACAIEDYLGVVDQVLVMTVHPGFGGQKFIPEMSEKVRHIRRVAPPSLDIAVDGGINPRTARLVVKAGANVLVAGTAIFEAEDRRRAIEALRDPGGTG